MLQQYEPDVEVRNRMLFENSLLLLILLNSMCKYNVKLSTDKSEKINKVGSPVCNISTT